MTSGHLGKMYAIHLRLAIRAKNILTKKRTDDLSKHNDKKNCGHSVC